MSFFDIFKRKNANVLKSQEPESDDSLRCHKEIEMLRNSSELHFNKELEILRNSNAEIIDIDRRGSGPERTLTVLFKDNELGYFCVRQSSGAYTGLGLWYYIIPKDVSDPKIENYIDDYKNFACVPNEWFSKEFESDMSGIPRIWCGQKINNHTL